MQGDLEFVGGLLRGDQSALEELYDRHRSLLYSVALRVTGDPGTAEELLQDTFFQLWQHASDFDTARGSLIGWLLTIIRHRAISSIRRKKTQISCEPMGHDTPESGCGSPGSPLQHYIARELVSSALAGLTQVQREAILLAYFDGMTCEEIAANTKTPLGTVKTRLRYAVKKMKSTLSESGSAVSAEPVNLPVTLESILITEQLSSRTFRPRNAQQETECLLELVKAAATSRVDLVDSFLQMPIDLCHAGTAGLSLLETNEAGEQVFRWTNLTGRLAGCVGGTTPRNFSPCGITLDRDSPQLFARPGRYFTYFNEVDVPIIEGLVIPFHVGPKTEGTVWILSHEEKLRFDTEDVRVMTSLTEFAGCALHLSRALAGKPAEQKL
jgi:RNA polymerase sigma factor (sigma-70 family)